MQTVRDYRYMSCRYFRHGVGLKSDEMGNVGDIFPVTDERIFNGTVVSIA